MAQDRSRESALVPDDSVGRYLAEVRKYSLLTREEEHELAVRAYEDGDREAAEKLVLSNLRLVVKIALDYRRVWTNLLDLVQEGNVGLMQAVKRYDPYRGVKFSSYAAYWIRAYLLKYLIDHIRIVRVGTSRAERKLFFRLNKTRRELESAGFRPEPKLLAEKLDVKEADVIDFERRMRESDLSLDAPISPDGDAAAFGDFIAAEGASVETEVGEGQLRRTLHDHVDKFSEHIDERELRILRDRILSEDPKTLQEIGEEFSLTRERVRQIEKRLVQKLRSYLKENLVDFDYYAPES